MNVSDSDRTHPQTTDDGLDARARQAHAASLGALSPRVRAQLQQRRRAALAGERLGASPRWAPMLAVAATLVLAATFGVRLLWPDAPDAPDSAVREIALAPPAASPAIDASRGSQSDAAASATDAHAADAPGTRVADVDSGLGPGTHVGESASHAASGAINADINAEGEVDAILAMFERTDTPDAFEDVADASDDDALLASLGESPDFYLWLSADDGTEVEAL